MKNPSTISSGESDERTPQDYAIEHAEYMAKSAERLIDAVNDLAIAESEVEEGTANASDVDAARDTLGEARTSLRDSIYEFRKRRDRAALATQPAESKACASVGEPKSNNQKEKKCTPTSADGTTQRNACLGIGGGPSSAITSSDTPTERELDLYDEIECDLPYLFGRAAFEGHASAQALADQVREKMKRARFLYATPPAAPAATEAPSKPFAYYIHIAAEQRGEFVHDLDEALDDLTNCECKITELFDHATPAPGAPGQEAAAVDKDSLTTQSAAVAQETDRDWSKAQDWKGMDGATAFLLINRHSDGWGDVGAMMNAWLAANADGEKPS